jgi:hypothetical protein
VPGQFDFVKGQMNAMSGQFDLMTGQFERMSGLCQKDKNKSNLIVRTTTQTLIYGV